MFKPFGGPPGPAGMDPMFKPGGVAATPGIVPQPEEQASGLSGLLGGLKEGLGNIDRNKAAMMMAALSNGFGNMTLRGNDGLRQMNNAIYAQASKKSQQNKSMEYLAKENPALHAKLMKLPEGVRDQYMGVVFENMLKPREKFSAATPEQLAAFGIKVDENGNPVDGKAYQVSSTTGELSAIGGGGQNINITNEADRDDAWLTHLVDVDKAADAGIRERGQNAFSSIYNLENLEKQLNNLGAVNQGPWSETKAEFSRIANSLGFSVNEEFLQKYQSVEAATNALVADELRKNKGPQTDFDAQFAASYTASGNKYSTTNRSIMNHRQGIAVRDQFISNLYQDELSGIGREDVAAQRAAARRWDEASRNVPTVIPRKNLAEDDEVRNGYSAEHIHFHEFVDRNRRLYPGVTDQDIFDAWKEAVSRARR